MAGSEREESPDIAAIHDCYKQISVLKKTYRRSKEACRKERESLEDERKSLMGQIEELQGRVRQANDRDEVVQTKMKQLDAEYEAEKRRWSLALQQAVSSECLLAALGPNTMLTGNGRRPSSPAKAGDLCQETRLCAPSHCPHRRTMSLRTTPLLNIDPNVTMPLRLTQPRTQQ